MGGENATFEKNGEMKLGLTFVSSTLVKIGDHLAEALCGGPAFGWVPATLRWLGFGVGAALGGAAFSWAGLDALWFATLTAAGCSAALLALRRG